MNTVVSANAAAGLRCGDRDAVVPQTVDGNRPWNRFRRCQPAIRVPIRPTCRPDRPDDYSRSRRRCDRSYDAALRSVVRPAHQRADRHAARRAAPQPRRRLLGRVLDDQDGQLAPVPDPGRPRRGDASPTGRRPRGVHVKALFAKHGGRSALTGEVVSGGEIHRYRYTIGTALLNNNWSQPEVQGSSGTSPPR